MKFTFFLRHQLVLIITTLLTACDKGLPEQKNSIEPVTTQTEYTANSGETIAKQCIECHGLNGIKAKNNEPFLAGQPFEYLKTALHYYRSGKRKHEVMYRASLKLTDTEIGDVSAYYSQLNTKWPSTKHSTSLTQYPGSVNRGLASSKPCKDCHGVDGNSHIAGVPSLAELKPDYFIKAFENYFTELRQGTIMKHFKRTVNWQELQDLAVYYSKQKRSNNGLGLTGNKDRGKKLSSRCAGCHGTSGSTFLPDMPNLAGQDAEYLIKAINAYKKGTRQNTMMKAAVAGLSKNNTKDISTYYATISSKNQTLPKSLEDFNPVQDGKVLAQNCEGCHGNGDSALQPDTPRLSGLSIKYFQYAMTTYKTNQRQHRMMNKFATQLDRTKIEKLAIYFSQLERKSSNLSKQTKVENNLLSSCDSCHGKNGNSSSELTPSIAEQDSTYLVLALSAYKNGRREHDDMKSAVQSLSESDITELATHYASQKLVAPQPIVLEPPQNLATKCDRCHGLNGFSTQANIPTIAGQNKAYLVKSLEDYKNGNRTHSMMFAMSDVLTFSEMEAISRYYSLQK